MDDRSSQEEWYISQRRLTTGTDSRELSSRAMTALFIYKKVLKIVMESSWSPRFGQKKALIFVP